MRAGRIHGFTLIELMIAIAVAGILAAVAIPSYNSYVMRGKIPEATSALATKRVQLEQYYQDNRTYVGAPACANDAVSSRNFVFSCSVAPTASTYTLQAQGVGSMGGFAFTVNQANVRATTSAPSGWTANGNCWITNKGGAC